MEVKFARFYVLVHLLVVFALFVSPFIFFNVYADETENVWKITISNGASENEKIQGFFPNELPVLVGDTIIWENNDNTIHKITSGVPNHPDHSGIFFNLGEIRPGDSKSYVLTNSEFGEYYYFCEIHPWMTGKFFLSDIEMAQPETDMPIFLEIEIHVIGEEVSISGQVHKDFAGTKYTTLIYDKNDELVESSNGFFDYDASYVQVIETQENFWKENEDYNVKLVYALPTKVAETSFKLTSKFVPNESMQSIPEWIKNVGDYWCNNQIDDTEFVSAIQFLIKNDIIVLKSEKSDSLSSGEIPEWVKNSTCWWADEKIPDPDFIFGIEYLVNIGTIKV